MTDNSVLHSDSQTSPRGWPLPNVGDVLVAIGALVITAGVALVLRAVADPDQPQVEGDWDTLGAIVFGLYCAVALGVYALVVRVVRRRSTTTQVGNDSWPNSARAGFVIALGLWLFFGLDGSSLTLWWATAVALLVGTAAIAWVRRRRWDPSWALGVALGACAGWYFWALFDYANIN